jgi:hypothetical protein
MFMAIAVALVAIAIVVFIRDIDQLVQTPAGDPFAVTVTRAVNSVLFIVVVLELGVNAGVIVALSIALVLVRRFARLDRA